jgi:hypothetical protein
MGVRKSAAEARKAFEEVLPYIPGRYVAMASKADWFTPASSDIAEENYKTEVTKAVAEKRRQNAIKALGGNAPWLDGVKSKGAPVIEARIRAALPKWDANWGRPYTEKVLPELERLPARTVDWKRNISERLVKTVEILKKAYGKPV